MVAPTPLQFRWESFERGVFLVNCLALVAKNGKILIGRREKDPYIQELSWNFPGGRPSYEESLTDSLCREVEKKTGLKITVLRLVFARILTENPRFLLLYYTAKIVGGHERPGELFVELKWVKPREALKLFTTSVDPYVRRLLSELVSSGENRAKPFQEQL